MVDANKTGCQLMAKAHTGWKPLSEQNNWPQDLILLGIGFAKRNGSEAGRRIRADRAAVADQFHMHPTDASFLAPSR
jgi:hypothetical protein